MDNPRLDENQVMGLSGLNKQGIDKKCDNTSQAAISCNRPTRSVVRFVLLCKPYSLDEWNLFPIREFAPSQASTVIRPEMLVVLKCLWKVIPMTLKMDAITALDQIFGAKAQDFYTTSFVDNVRGAGAKNTKVLGKWRPGDMHFERMPSSMIRLIVEFFQLEIVYECC